jgi:hypothetical protein
LNSGLQVCSLSCEPCLHQKKLSKWKHLKSAEALRSNKNVCVCLCALMEVRGGEVALRLRKHWKPHGLLYMRHFTES